MATTVAMALAWAVEENKKKSGRADATKIRTLLEHALGKEKGFAIVFPEFSIDDQSYQKFQQDMAALLEGVPITRILGMREFWSLPFQLSKETLDPRPDSETLIETVLSIVSAQRERYAAPRILDFGTGSGCLILSLLHELPEALGIGVDLSLDALTTARLNAKNLGLAERVSFIQSNWGEKVEEPFDIIISNPPYIKSDDIRKLDETVKNYDPLRALDGGEDGLECYRILIPQAKSLLTQGGVLVLEIGWDQAEDVMNLLKRNSAHDTKLYYDIEGRPRIISAFF